MAFLSPSQERWLQRPRRRDRVTGCGLHHCTPTFSTWTPTCMEEVTCKGGVLSPEAPLEGCCVSSKESATPAPAPRKSPRSPHLRGVPHRPLSALLAPGSLSQPPPGLLGAGSGVQCRTKLRMSRPSSEGAGPGRGQGLAER